MVEPADGRLLAYIWRPDTGIGGREEAPGGGFGGDETSASCASCDRNEKVVMHLWQLDAVLIIGRQRVRIDIDVISSKG